MISEAREVCAPPLSTCRMPSMASATLLCPRGPYDSLLCWGTKGKFCHHNSMRTNVSQHERLGARRRRQRAVHRRRVGDLRSERSAQCRSLLWCEGNVGVGSPSGLMHTHEGSLRYAAPDGLVEPPAAVPSPELPTVTVRVLRPRSHATLSVARRRRAARAACISAYWAASREGKDDVRVFFSQE